MPMLFDASECLVYFPERMSTRRSLWLMQNILDVDSVKDNSATVASEDFDCLRKCEPFFSAFPSVFLAIADGEYVNRLAEWFAESLPSIQVLTPRAGAFGAKQSVREVLEAGGEMAVSRLIMGAVEQNAFGLLDLADVEKVDPLSVPAVMTGIKALDSAMGGFSAGELSIWTGKRGSGKSTILGQMLLDGIDQGFPVCAYSGELPAWRFKQWVALQAAGLGKIISKRDDASGKLFFWVPNDTMAQIDAWWKGKFFLYDNKLAAASDEDSILSVFEYAVRRYGCSMFLMDNLMTARFSTSSDRDFYRAQSNFTGRLVEFAKKHEVHVHLVAHPRKADGKLAADDVSGSGDVTNRADNVFSLERLEDDMVTEKGYDAVLRVLKNRSYGNTGSFGLRFDPRCRRYKKPEEPARAYGWETENG